MPQSVQPREHGNLVDAHSVPGERGWFELRAARGPQEVMALYPMSGPGDVERALEAARAAAPGWNALRASARGACLAAAHRNLASQAELFALGARALGLLSEEIAPFQLAPRSEEAPRPCGVAPGAGIALVAPHWSESAAEIFADVATELVLGRAAALAADPRMPCAAEAVGRALLSAGIPPGAISVLFGLDEAALASLARAARAIHSRGDRRAIARLRRSVEDGGTCEMRLSRLRSGTCELALGADLDRAALEVVERAFGRTATLSGQRAGALARVHCPEHLFSDFTARLLATLEASPAALDPLPLVDRQALASVRATWATGLDEGATLIFGGEGFLERGVAEGNTDRRVFPTVFTNVELASELARRVEPEPVLALLRVRGGSSMVQTPLAG